MAKDKGKRSALYYSILRHWWLTVIQISKLGSMSLDTQ